MPFEKVVETLAPKRDPSRNPLFQVNFRVQPATRPVPTLAGVEVEPIAVDIGFSRFDLALELELTSHAFEGYFEYDEDLFHAASIASFEESLRALLAKIVECPDLPVLELACGSRSVRGRPIRRRSRP
jgi:non-ribosomal peptide synthetase component F